MNRISKFAIDRRRFMVGATAATGALAMPAVARGAPRELVIGTNGGAAYEGFYRTVLRHFEARHNVKIVPVFGSGAELLNRVIAERANPTMDVIGTFQGAWLVGKAEGVFEKVNYSKIDHIDDVYETVIDPEGYAPYVNFGAWGLVYDESAVTDAPRSFKDLWDPRFANQVMIGGIHHWQIHLAAFAHAWTGDQHNIDAAFDKVKELAPTLGGFYGLSSDAQSKFQQGIGSVATWYNFAAQRVSEAGVPLRFVTPEEGAFLYPQAYHAIKGRENIDLVEKFIGTMFDPELSVDYARTDGFMPANKKARLDDQLKANMLTPEEIMASVNWDWEFVNANQNAWLDRWNAEVLPLVRG